MTKQEFSKICNRYSLTFYQGIQLSSLISESKWSEKFRNNPLFEMNDGIKGHQKIAIDSLFRMGFIKEIGNRVSLTDKCNGFPHMGPNVFPLGFDSQDVLDLIVRESDLSENQQILLDQIKHATEHNGSLTVTCGRYKTSFQTLRSLVNKGLVKTDKRFGIGFSTFQCVAL